MVIPPRYMPVSLQILRDSIHDKYHILFVPKEQDFAEIHRSQFSHSKWSPARSNLARALGSANGCKLNEDYGDTGLTFSLANTTRTVNPEWCSGVKPGSTLQDDMKKQLRQGDAGALNIYSVSFHAVQDIDGILLGYSTFPVNYTNNAVDDGVVIRYNVLPGESGAEFGVSEVNDYIVYTQGI